MHKKPAETFWYFFGYYIKTMKDSTYRLIAGLLKLLVWRGRLAGREYLPRRGPAVFVCNHADAVGPIACVSEIPLRLYPWTHWKMMDAREITAYLREDFVEKSLRLRQPLSNRVAAWLAPLVLALLRGVGCIPVYRGQAHSLQHTTWQASLARLRAGQCLLVFPEDPDAPEDPQTGVRSFMRGVLWLADIYFRATGQALPFYLLAVNPSRRMLVHPPISLGAQDFSEPGGKARWLQHFERTIKDMLLELDGQQKGQTAHPEGTPVGKKKDYLG